MGSDGADNAVKPPTRERRGKRRALAALGLVAVVLALAIGAKSLLKHTKPLGGGLNLVTELGTSRIRDDSGAQLVPDKRDDADLQSWADHTSCVSGKVVVYWGTFEPIYEYKWFVISKATRAVQWFPTEAEMKSRVAELEQGK